MGRETSDDEKSIQTPADAVREAMERAGWSQSDLAFVLGVTTATINQVLTGKRGISHNMAKLLGRGLDIQPETLAKLQAEWEISQADEPDPIVDARARVFSQYPLREMIKRGWISDSRERSDLERQVCNFFEVKNLDEVPHLAHAARRSNYDNIPGPQLSWLFRVRQIAREMTTQPYNRARLEKAISALSELRSEPDGVRYVPRLMEEAGVRFVVVECLPGSKIDGVCLWLDAKSPVIGMSLRFDRIDNFWFVLRHECAHVLHGHGKRAAIVDADLEESASSDLSEEERIANEEGAEFCIPQDKLKSFYLRKKPFFSERDVLAFAKRMGVHPGLVVGQLQRKTERYDLLRRHLVKVRDDLADAMMMDGWGDVVPVEA